MPGSNYIYNNNTGEFPIFINEMKNIFAIPMAFYKNMNAGTFRKK